VKDELVRQFVEVDGFVPEMIAVPSEFSGLKFGEGEMATRSGRKVSRSFIPKRSSKNLDKYDVWRCSDRSVLKGDGKHFAVAKLQIAPAHLVKLFGSPDMTEVFFHGTGQYSFEDNNLDMFCLFDYKQTDFYHGHNREDEFYETASNLKKQMHKRRQKYPSIKEFWESTEPQEFKLSCDD
jgi:hypothetical protein